MSTLIAVLVSGRGSNFEALLEAERQHQIDGSIRCVISSTEQAPALDIAREASIETCVYADPETCDQEILEALQTRQIDLVCLAGYMRILSSVLTTAYAGRVLNIHPSLLPLYPGLDTHRRVLTQGDTVHGCTVHFVTAKLDQGPSVIQASVPVLGDDDEETLAQRVLMQEHRIFPLAVQWFCARQLRLEGEQVWLNEHTINAPVIYEMDY